MVGLQVGLPRPAISALHAERHFAGHATLGLEGAQLADHQSGCLLASNGGGYPDYQRCPGFKAYYVIYTPDDTVTAISIFDNFAGARNQTDADPHGIEQYLAPLLTGPTIAMAGPVIVRTLA
jgi:hypothetical protein